MRPRLTHNPYQSPQANLDSAPEGAASGATPALWNPNAAANWSLLFSPIFGALLQSKNWEALGEPAKAAVARRWAMVAIGYFALCIVANTIVVIMQLGSLDLYIQTGGFALLLGWYFSIGREQARFVKERFGNHYPRRGWGKPFLFVLLGVFACAVLGGVIGLICGVVINLR